MKTWLAQTAKARGAQARPAGGTARPFFLSTTKASPGDYGAFITAAEWLDVNYGRLVRELLLGDLGGQSIHVIEPTAAPFPDAAATAAITCFQVGRNRARSNCGAFPRSMISAPQTAAGWCAKRLEASQRWTPLLAPRAKDLKASVELGELSSASRSGNGCEQDLGYRVRHGRASGIGPIRVGHWARELFAAGAALLDPTPLRRVIDLPPDLDGFEGKTAS